MELENAAAIGAGYAAGAASAAAAAEVLVRLTTPIERLRVPNVPIAVPTTLNKQGLAKVVQHLLGLADGEEELQLEFFVSVAGAARRPLRGTLGKALTGLGLSHEQTITLEYALPLPAPRIQASQPQDDWVGAVDGGERCVVDVALTGAHPF